VDSRFGPKNLIEAAIHWHPYPTPHPSVFLDMISQDAGPECVGTPIESASSVRDVVIVNSDRILPVEGEECCASAGELIKSEPTPSAVDSRIGPKNLIEAAIHWHPYPTPHPSVFLDMISQDAGPECVGTPIESASSVRDVVIVNSDRIIPVEGEECCASAGELIKSEPTPSAVDSRFGPKNLIEAAIHWHPYPTPHPSVFLDMISQDTGPECVGTPIESASSVCDVVIVNSDRILPVEGEECCASADDKKNDATILTMPTSLKEDRDIYCCDGERKKGERKDASVMSIREEHCAREDDKKNDLRVFLTTAPSLFGGEMKLGERNDAAFMTTLMHGDIGNEENQKHHLSVDQVQCAKRFCTRTECGGTHIELIANVRDVVSINIGHIFPNIEEEKHCITKIDGEIDATVIAAVRKSFQEVSDGLKSDHSTKSCSEPLCIAIDDETVTNIIQFVASTMGDVYVLSQTCKQWNEILNKIPNTANPIWYKIARRY
jgi:uncharacterized Zn-finger protein